MVICIRYQSLFIIYLCTKYHFISFMNKTKPIYFLFVISSCTIYYHNRSVNIRFARNGQKCSETNQHWRGVASFSEIRGQMLRHYGGEGVALFFLKEHKKSFGL